LKKRNYPEYDLQKQVCEWLDWQCPDVNYMSDTVAFLRLTIPQANRNKKIQKDGFKTPDLIIFRPMGGYSAMFLELKVETPWKKNGDLKKSEHLEGQWQTILDLRKEGYWADFSWGFDNSINHIKNYLNGNYMRE